MKNANQVLSSGDESGKMQRSERIKEERRQASENQAKTDWNSLTELAGKYPTERPVRGLSSGFKREAAEHRSNAEKFYDQASSAQKESLKNAGIRDAKDAAEYLHEQESWNRQVDKQVKVIDGNVDQCEQVVYQMATVNNCRDARTGEFLPDSVILGPDTEPEKEMDRKRFLEYLDENAPRDDLIYQLARRDVLGDGTLDEQDEEPEPEPRSREALLQEAEERWLSNEERMNEVRKYGSYASAKRVIEKELAKAAAELASA